MILYNALDIKVPNFKRRLVSNWIKEIAILYKKRVGDVAYIFCTDEKILAVNNEYLSHNYYTDVITFDYSEADILSGDIFISLDTVKSNAEKFNVPFIRELYRVMIHAILHLCGINDRTEEERQIMIENENKALEQIQ